MTTRQRTILALIMLLAAFLRVEYLLQIEHNVDHAYPIWQALQTLDRGAFPLVGQGTSVLFANPPLTGYLFLPFVALTRSPLGIYMFVIALNTVAVLLAFRAARLIVGANLALIAAFLMAVNPWVIEYSRTSWVQSLLPFLVCALAWSLWSVLLGTAKHPARRLLIALVILTVAAQTYLLAFMLVIPVGLLLLFFWRRIPKRALAVGAAIFIAAAAIYGAGLVAQRDAVSQRLTEFSANTPHLSADALNHAIRLVSGADYAIARGTLAPIDDSALRESLSTAANGIVAALMLLGVIAALIALRDSAQRPRALIVLVWFAVPILLMTYVGQVIHPFYQLLGIPAGYILAAWGLGVVGRPIAGALNRLVSPEIAWRVALLPFLAFGVLMGINSARYYQDTAATPGIDGLGALPLEYGLRLGALLRDDLSRSVFPTTVYADVDEWTLASLSGRTLDFVRDARAPDFNFIPPNGGAYVAAVPDASEITVLPGSVDFQPIVMRDKSVAYIVTLSQAALDITHPMEIHSDQGISFRGYDLNRDADQWALTTYWRVDARVDDTDERLFAPFAHVFDASGSRVLIVDGQAVPGYEWRVGDWHVHRMTFMLPSDAPAPFTISVGQYDAIHQQNAIFNLLEDDTPLVPLPDALEP